METELSLHRKLVIFASAFSERCLSGRKGRFAKPLYAVKVYREFESLPLRKQVRGVVQLASMPALGAGGRRFESCHLD